MQIIKYRRGFATNSSSSHSIILAGSFSSGQDLWSSGEYGWEWFCLEDELEKLRYMATQLYSSGIFGKARTWGGDPADEKINDDAREKIRKLLGVSVPRSAYVDHQSVMSFPLTWDGKGTNLEFARDLCTAIAKDPTVAIRGGNDNDDRCTCEYDAKCTCGLEGTSHPELGDSSLREYDTKFSSLMRARKSNGVWVLFNPRDGTKVHLNLGDKISQPDKSYRPEFPELVDIKITGYCEKNCKFCYQDSDEDGQHANTSRIINWMQTCKDAGVIELAIGGGEPTEHPDFVEILKEANKHFLAVSFSTRSLKWLRTKKRAHEIAKLVKGVGFSVSSKKEIDVLTELWNTNFSLKNKRNYNGEESFTPHLTLHIIPDYMSAQSVQAIIKASGWGKDILLLGSKSSGRGGGMKKRNGMEGLKLAAEDRWGGYLRRRVAIDTAFAAEHRDLLDKWEIDPRLYYSDEGRYSLYYDAVTNQFGPSSYQPESMKDATPTFERSQGAMARSSLSVQEMFNKVWTMRV